MILFEVGLDGVTFRIPAETYLVGDIGLKFYVAQDSESRVVAYFRRWDYFLNLVEVLQRDDFPELKDATPSN